MRLYLKICGLTIAERETVLKKINLIKNQLYPDLQVQSTLNKYYPNEIQINQIIPDEETAILLFKCLNALNYNPEKDNNWDYHKFNLLLDVRYTWNDEGKLVNADGELIRE